VSVLMVDMLVLLIVTACARYGLLGGGPLEEGTGSYRWSNDIQRSFYNAGSLSTV